MVRDRLALFRNTEISHGNMAAHDRHRAEPALLAIFAMPLLRLYKDGLRSSPVSRASSWVGSDGKV
jgi:hypothetical protein